MKKILLLIIPAILFTTGCRQSAQTADRETSKDTTVHSLSYVRPEIPVMMTDPQERAAYYVQHYWDGYSLADTVYLHSGDTEQLYADFIDALQHAAPEEYPSALRTMMTHMEADSTAYAHFCRLSEKYLYDANSPMRNEDYYIPVLEQMLQSPRLTELDKLRPADRLKQARKNRPGMVAADFTYVTPKGETHRLSQLQADYILLFFYDPDCSNCSESEHILASIPFFLDMQNSGKLRVLAVYADENKDEWLQKSSAMPAGWIVGWNRQGDIRGKQLYEIRATPTLYLLDRQKKVILKDASLERVVQYLSAGQ